MAKRTKIGIMGFGRIGREFFRMAYNNPDLDIAAIVDIGNPEILNYLQDVEGLDSQEVRLEGNYLVSPYSKSRMFIAKNPSDIPWDVFEVDYVIDCTHKFCSRHEMEDHLKSGASRVIISSLPRDSIDRIVIMGANEESISLDDRLISAGSSTTNALVLALKLINEEEEIAAAMLTSVHAFTSDQPLQNVAGRDFRRSRSAAENIIPNITPTSAWIDEILPELSGKVDGIALNVPVSKGSMLDLTLRMKKKSISLDDIHKIFENASKSTSNLVEYNMDPIVSSDVIGNTHSLVYDSQATQKTEFDMVKILCWYDNGICQAARVLDVLTSYISLENSGGAK